MDTSFKNTKMRKNFNEGERLEREYGPQRAKKIRIRLKELRDADTLEAFWPPKSPPSRCHELTGNRKGQLSVDLDHPYRLIFVPNHDPLPLQEDGGLDWGQVSMITIWSVEDTHE